MFNQTLPSLTTELSSLVSIELVRAERRRRRIQVIPGTFVPVLSYRITYITFSFVGHSVPILPPTCIVLKSTPFLEGNRDASPTASLMVTPVLHHPLPRPLQ